ncbi:MAG: pitrilysin family protein [Candidatus Eisenbacteria bacterium]
MSDLRPRKAVLPNGLVLLTVTREDSPIVAVLLMYKAGSLYEPPGKTGLAHLTEHMMFRGTPSRPQGDIDQLTGRLGGTNNAMTTCDHTLYYFVLPSEHWVTPLSIEADRMFHCEFGREAFETERRVAIEERMMLDDDPETLLYEAVDALAFDTHPYRYPVIGLMDDLEGITLENLRAFYAERYRPEEAVLAVVGGATHDEVLSEVSTLFGATAPPLVVDPTPRAGGKRADPRFADPPVTEPRRSVLSGLSPSSEVVLSFRTPAATHEDTPALELLSALLSSGRSSLMYTRLVDDLGVATEVSTSKIPQTDSGLLYLSASLHSGVSPEACENEILDIVSGLVRSGVSEDGLSRAKNLTRVDLMLGRETSLGQAGALAFWECLGDWRLGEEHEKRIEQATAADVRRVAERYLDPSTRSSAWLVP